ncbi:Cytosolic copper metallochaperone [Kluyveromyces marxianus]|nr:Cytosolic copper metallochaperone [Kluyveromyces marxianus]
MSTNHYQFNVKIGAVERALSRLQPEVSKTDISLEKQTVDVYTTLPYETVLEKIKKTGKEVVSGTTL